MKYNYLKYPTIRFRIVRIIFSVIIITTILTGYCIDVKANESVCRWEKVNVPRQGDIGQWVLAKGSDISCLTIADDNTLYCCADSSYAQSKLFRSEDSGKTWRYTGGIKTAIKDIIVVSSQPSILYYTDGNGIYRSEDRGISFRSLPDIPDVDPNEHITITSIDVTVNVDEYTIYAGTRDADSSEFGKIYVLSDNGSSAQWEDTGIYGYDICDISVSPAFQQDNRVFAVVTNDTDTCVISKEGTDPWNSVTSPAVIPGIVTDNASIDFSLSYDGSSGNFSLFTSIDSINGTGDVFRIDFVPLPSISTSHDLDIGKAYEIYETDASDIVVGSDTTLFAGASDSSTIYYSHDNGETWLKSERNPTGESITGIVADTDYNINQKLYAVTFGRSSAFSCSVDHGVTFDQLSLVDAEISDCANIDLAPSPQFAIDHTVFMLTIDVSDLEYSLWRTTTAGDEWERVFSSSVYSSAIIRGIAVPPDYNETNKVLFMHGVADGVNSLWKTTNNAKTFNRTSTPYGIDTWNFRGSNDIYIGCFNGSDALLFHSVNGGDTWDNGFAALPQVVKSISFSPDYDSDAIFAVSTYGGRVYYSDDAGRSFRPLPLDAFTPPFTGGVSVAFDPDFSTNKMIYAVSDAEDEGIYRFILGISEQWEKLGDIPSGYTITSMQISHDGILYGVNTDHVDLSAGYGGVERTLDPASDLSPVFETFIDGLADGAVLRKLWISGNRIWSVDIENGRLMTCMDVLARPVDLVYPTGDCAVYDSESLQLRWESLQGVTGYDWQLDSDGSFTSVSAGQYGTVNTSCAELPNLGTGRYFWRVRAVTPLMGQWSETSAFTLVVSTPLGECPELRYPGVGNDRVSIQPLFQWSVVPDVQKYELIIANDTGFTSPVIRKIGINAINSNVWQSDVALENNTTYYWKVRGVTDSTYTEWSTVSAFITAVGPESQIQDETVSRTVIVHGVPVPSHPLQDSERVAAQPLFQWTDVAGAQGYELVVATETSFENPVIVRNGEHILSVPTWKCNINLDPDTAYFWKVRAVFADETGEWSPVHAFIVETPPDITASDHTSVVEEPEPVAETERETALIQGVPLWVSYLGIGLLITSVILQVVILLVNLIARG